MKQSPAPDVMEFSTDHLSERERLPFWSEVLGRKVVKLEVDRANGLPFRQRMRAHAFDGLAVIRGSTSGMLAQRTKSLLADSSDDLLFVTNLTGFSLCSQVGRDLKLDAGEGTFLSCGEVGFQNFPAPADWLNIRMPRRALSELVPNSESWVVHRVPPHSEGFRLLTGYATTAFGQHEWTTPHVRRLVATHLCDLLAIVIGGTRDAIEVAQERGLRAARLSAVKADIAANLDRPGFSLDALAVRHGLSPLYVRKLFEDEGTSFTAFALGQRLARAYRMLTDPHAADRTVSSIAFAVGFGDLSYFNRSFHRRYGAAPSDVRERARCEARCDS